MNANKSKRKYTRAWELLKANKTILAEVTLSDSSVVINRYARTYIRGIQKEKYLDDTFRLANPFAQLTSEVTGNTVRITLELNNYDNLEV